MKTALVTGVNGQDGYYMVEYLKSFDEYERIYAIKRKDCDITSPLFDTILEDFMPDEIYNFGGNSNNLRAFDDPYELMNSNTIPVIKILNYQKKSKKKTKFFQASSSLIFGENNDGGFQTITTKKDPTTPYGASKLYAYNLIQTYKKHYDVYAVNGILYNHESTRRKPYFVMPKIVKGLLEYKKTGVRMEIGDLEAKRDWIHAKDVIRGAYLSLKREFPVDYIFSSGKMTSVRELMEYVGRKIGIDWKNSFETNTEFINKRQENNYSGLPNNTNIELGWKPTYSVQEILDELIEHYK